MEDATSVRQPLLPAHPLKTTATMTSYLSCNDDEKETQTQKQTQTHAAAAAVEAHASLPTMARSGGVLIRQDGGRPSAGRPGAPARYLSYAPRRLRARLRFLYIHNRFLRMALFTLSAAWVLWSLLLLSSDDQRALAAPAAYTTRPCTAATFSKALPSYADVQRVNSVAAGGSYGEGAADLGFPTNATNLPALCAVTVHVRNGSSDYRFGLFLPTAAQYNGRILTVGSYSFAGGINWPDMGQGPHYGFATLASDGGHNSTQDALDWAPTTPDKLADWGYRSLHGSIALGKVLTQTYYSDAAIAYSYYSGCSTGGRQGLKEIQISPDSFDGALVGAPAWDTSRLMPWATRVGASNLPETAAGHLDVAEFATLAAAALAQCDGLDGHNDSIISRPERCALDLAKIECGGAANPNPSAPCLTSAQIATAASLYADAYTARGEFIHSGYSAGSEDLWYIYLAYGDEEDFDTRYERFWLYNDTAWNWTRYSDQTFYDSLAANPGNATADAYDISAYRDRGGKVLLYQGLADGLIMPRTTTGYYNATLDAMRLTLDDDPQTGIQTFFRYMLVPGMQHCYATPAEVNAPWMFAAPGQATVLLQSAHFGAGWGVPNQPASAAHDALLALVAWVEQATPPESIVATTWNNDGSVNRTRPLCVYPKEATYNGTGSLNLAANWHCQ